MRGVSTDWIAGFEPLVALVGAGPGDPGLITVRGAELLARADLVLYDRLVAAELLQLAPPGAERLCVDQLPGCQPDRIGAIALSMGVAASQGRRVVRLKGGDPILFGRCLEELEPLIARGIHYEIVPGVTAALGAAACAGIPLTDRRLASAVALVTGHENPTKSEGMLDWEALARFPGTLVFYMAVTRMDNVVARLLAGGKLAATPAAVVSRATLHSQKVVQTTLGEMVDHCRQANLQPPAICLIGQVVDCRATLSWFDRRPLFGRRVLCCRPAGQELPLLRWVQQAGGWFCNIPTLEIQPVGPGQPLPGFPAIGALPAWDWVVFSSVPGVRFFFDHLAALGLDVRALGGVRVAAVGRETAQSLAHRGLVPDCVPESFQAEALAAALLPKIKGLRVLLPRADRGRDVLSRALGEVACVTEWIAYRQVDRSGLDESERAWLAEGQVDAVLLTSGNIVRALAKLAPDYLREDLRSGRTAIFSLSPVTTAVIVELGWKVAGEADEATSVGLMKALQVWGKRLAD